MKRLLFTFSLIGLFLTYGCDNDSGADNCIEIRVLSSVCGTSIVQVVSGSFPGDLVTWTDSDDNQYNNVFGTFIDPCLFDLGEGDNSRLFIEVIDEPVGSSCIMCLALPANMPENFYHIKQVEDCSEINDL